MRRLRVAGLAAVAAVAAGGAGAALATAGSAGPARVAPAAGAIAVVVERPGAPAVRLLPAPARRPGVQGSGLALRGSTGAGTSAGALVRVAGAGAVTSLGPDAVGGAVSLRGVRLLGGEVTAAAVDASYTHPAVGAAQATPGAGGPVGGGATLRVRGLAVLGRPVAARLGSQVALGDWGILEIGAVRPGGRFAALRLRLVAAHLGAPAGTVVTLGSLAARGVPAPEPHRPASFAAARTTAGRAAPATVRIARAAAHLAPGRHAFPLPSPVPVTDTYGTGRAGVSWHHGVDLFAPRGTPVLAVADGTLLEVGWNPLGGNRLWLRDAAGNLFYYAHLDAFAEGVRSGAGVRAGAPLGTVGRSGDAERTPAHLHFEIHPAGFTPVGYDGSMNPTALLRAWGAGLRAAPQAAPLPAAAPGPGRARPAAYLFPAGSDEVAR